MNAPNDEAQRELERRALRNVRQLVDRMEESDAADMRTQKRILGAIVAIAAAVAVGIGGFLYFKPKPDPVEIDVAKLPPVKAGPPQKTQP